MVLTKIFCILIVIVFMSNAVLADIAQERPDWNDVCPKGLENAQYKELKWFWPEGTKNLQELYNYWAKKREDFEEALLKCDFLLEDFRNACYDNLRSKQEINAEFYNNMVRNKNFDTQIRKDNSRTVKPIMINVFSL